MNFVFSRVDKVHSLKDGTSPRVDITIHLDLSAWWFPWDEENIVGYVGVQQGSPQRRPENSV